MRVTRHPVLTKGFLTEEATRRTIANTTQVVKTLRAETQDYMHDHYKTQVLALRPLRFIILVSILGARIQMLPNVCFKPIKSGVHQINEE
eukprot:scaffold2125_cov123-Chaetoceros_neogracile.AAC.4